MHPQSVDEHSSIDWVAGALPHDEVVGIGETGLDYSNIADADVTTRRLQRECFAAHLALAQRHALPVIVHTRAAEDDTRDLLRAHAGAIGVLHCFTESWALARAALDLGWYVSISGIVTFRNADNVREVATADSDGPTARRDRLSVARAGAASRQDQRAVVCRGDGEVPGGTSQ